jgi:hypothetical protein
MGKRSIQKQREALAPRGYPEPAMPLNSEYAKAHYERILEDMPKHFWDKSSVNLLACQSAEISTQLERLNAVVAAEDLIQPCSQGERAHPALVQIGALSGKLATLLGRLKVLPQADAHEMQRQAKYEQKTGRRLHGTPGGKIRSLLAGYDDENSLI